MRRLLVLLGLVAVIGAPVLAQRWYGQRLPRTLAYDGRFVFVRLWYADYPGWSYDWPDTEENLGKLLPQITAISTHPGNGNIFRMDDPELLKYPVAYLSEPGYWIPSESETEGLRTYLAKGGFLIVDDFMRGEWYNFERQIRRALPEARIDRLTVEHPVFDSFFHLESLDMSYPHNQFLKAEFLGIHEQNDARKRLMVVINYNNDIGDYMEWSDDNFWPVNITNDAYKLAINYIIYGMTH